MYHIGEIIRTKNTELPELLPVGYLVGDTMQIGICLKGKSALLSDKLSLLVFLAYTIIIFLKQQ